MSMLNIAGLESYMEEEIDIDINIGSDEVAEEVQEAVEAEEEVSEVVEDEVEEEAQVEETMRFFDQVETLISVIEEEGVNRTVLRLYNQNDALANMLRISLPATESFDAVGSTQSAESIACLEGLKEVAGKVWEFIKKVCAKIRDLLGRFAQAIINLFTSMDKQIGRLRKAHKDRKDDADKLKDVEVKVFTDAELKKLYSSNFKVKIKELSKYSDVLAGKIGQVTAKAADKGEIKEVEAASKFLEELSNKKSKANSVKLSSIDYSAVPAYLDAAAQLSADVKGMKQDLDMSIRAAKNAYDRAIAAEKRGDTPEAKEVAKNARDLVKAIKKSASAQTKALGFMTWIAKQYVRTASMRISRGSSK